MNATRRVVLSVHWVAVLGALSLLAGVGCTARELRGEREYRQRETGTVDFELVLPNGEEATTIDLHLECPGITQDHSLDVEDGVAKAAFGGLEGMCTVTLSTVTPEGTNCAGSETFTVVENDVIPVAVTLTCQGINPDPGGGAVINPNFVTRECTNDRIRKIYAVPSALLLGASTDVQVEVHPGSLVGAATYTFGVVTGPTDVGEASLMPVSGACAPGAQACRNVECDGIGGSSAIDPVTGLPVASVLVSVTVEDDDCRDTETVRIECLQDDDVQLPVCGDNIIQVPSEQCDGTALPPGQPLGTTCSASCQLVAPTQQNQCLQCATTGQIATALTNDLCSLQSDPLCYAVLQCYIGEPGNGGCFLNAASPAECYCGQNADTDACATAAYEPTGPCVSVMRATNPGATNEQILDGMFNFDTLGWAGQIMLELQALCPFACDSGDWNPGGGTLCGNGVRNGGEQCDGLAGLMPGQVCSAFCNIIPVCSNGIIESGEQCDGSAGVLPGQVCGTNCRITPTCGNAIIESGETCDGTVGTQPGQVCGTDCRIMPVCGNGIREASEVCDGSQGLQAVQVCGADCRIVPTCSNGIVESPEECDDGNLDNTDLCLNNCERNEPGTCHECVNGGPIAEALTNDLCSTMSDPLCAAVLACYIDTGCFAGGATPAECYCGAGADTDACATAAFIPAGPCVTQMRAAKPSGTNSDILDGVFAFDSLGWAGQIMLEAQAICPNICGF